MRRDVNLGDLKPSNSDERPAGVRLPVAPSEPPPAASVPAAVSTNQCEGGAAPPDAQAAVDQCDV